MKKIAVRPDEYIPYGQRQVYTHGWLLSDLNGDGVVDAADESIVSASSNPVADLDGDIDTADLAIVQADNGQAQPAHVEMRARHPTRTRTLCSWCLRG